MNMSTLAPGLNGSGASVVLVEITVPIIRLCNSPSIPTDIPPNHLSMSLTLRARVGLLRPRRAI